MQEHVDAQQSIARQRDPIRRRLGEIAVAPDRRPDVGEAFADVDADIYVMADGDATYEAAAAPRMVAAMLEDNLDMVVGSRRDEVEAVLGHEVAHVANGDMVTLTLLQGVLNTFVIFLSRVVGFIVDRFLNRSEDGEESSGTGPAYFITSLVLQIVFGIGASLIVAWFSRRREFRADDGGAQLVDAGSMARALDRLRRWLKTGGSPGAGPLVLELAREGVNWLWPEIDELVDSEDLDVAFAACEALECAREEQFGPLH